MKTWYLKKEKCKRIAAKIINVVLTLAKDSNLSELGDFSFLEFQTKVICTFPRKGNMLYNFNKKGSTII